MSRADRRPIVVGGCHRSGTSLLRRILDAHSRIHCGPEVPFFRDLVGDYREDPVGHLRFMAAAGTLVAPDALLEILGAAFLALHERAAAHAGKPRWADKAPENVLYTGGWQRLLGEEWVFLHVVRNPLDVLASMAETGFPRTLPSDLRGRAAFYTRYVQAGLAYVEEHSPRARTVVYEELVSDPEASIAELMRWLGERAEAVQLSFNDVQHASGLEDPKVARTTSVHDRSVGRWRQDLSAEEVAAAWAMTAATWREIDPTARWMADP